MRYEKYKDSGIEWIEKIPHHWKVKKLRTLGKFTSSGIDKKIDEGEEIIKIINYTDVYGNESLELTNSDYMEVSATENQIKKHMVKKGDLIFTPSSETIEDIGISALVKDNLENTSFSYHVVRFHFCDNNEISFNYKKYLCNNHYVYNYFSSQARGTTRQTLNRKDFKDAIVFIPPLCEQIIIAKYLDDETSKIDSIIKDLESEKEKLEVYKRELIAEVVTKGLNNNIPMKDSGVEWIGEVPEHWEVYPLFYLYSENNKKNTGNKNSNLLSLSYGNIIRKDIETTFGLLPESFENYQVVESGDIILRLTDLQNDKRSLRTGLVCENGIITSAYVGIRNTNDEINNEYMHYLLHSYDLKKVFYSMGSGLRQSLGFSEIRRLPILLPPIEEQRSIVNKLNNKQQEINKAKENIHKQIEKLKEYRKILIHEAVTGKVKIDGGAN